MDDEPSELETTVVRLFVGHAETPVWFSGPRDWDEMCLGDDLTADLRAWDAAWYASRDPDDFRWTAAEPEVEHRRRGVELAGRLAEALGPPFVVQVDAVDDPDAPDDPGADDGAYRPPSRTAVASDRPATRPEAAARFRAWSQEARAEHDRIRAAVADGGGRWVAYAPLSGRTFAPGTDGSTS